MKMVVGDLLFALIMPLSWCWSCIVLIVLPATFYQCYELLCVPLCSMVDAIRPKYAAKVNHLLCVKCLWWGFVMHIYPLFVRPLFYFVIIPLPTEAC